VNRARVLPIALAALLFAAALVAILVSLAHSRVRGVGPSVLVGSRAADYALLDLRGRTVSLAAYSGKVVVLNLWASWCPPCRLEMPDLERLYEKEQRLGLVVLGVNEGESAQRARAFGAALHIRFPILLDQEQRFGRVYAALGIPTTIVIDRAGFVARGFDGPLDYDQMAAATLPLLR